MFVPVAAVDEKYDALSYRGSTYLRINANGYAVDSAACVGEINNGESPLERILFPFELFSVKNDSEKRYFEIRGKEPHYEGVYCRQENARTVERELQDADLDAEYVGELKNKTVPIAESVGRQLESIRERADDMPLTTVAFGDQEEKGIQSVAVDKYVLNRCFYRTLSNIKEYNHQFYYVVRSGYTAEPGGNLNTGTYSWFALPDDLQRYLSAVFQQS